MSTTVIRCALPNGRSSCSRSPRFPGNLFPAREFDESPTLSRRGRGGDDADAELLQLLVVDAGGRARQRVQAGLRLREGDDLADVLLAREARHQPVDAERETAVRRGAVAERGEEEAEA